MATGKSSGFSDSFLALILNGTTISSIAINATSSPLTSLYASLHTANPTASGNQTSSETTYPGYTREAIARTSSGFTVSGATATLTSQIAFPACTGSTSDVITYWALGTASTGTGEILWFGEVSPTVSMSNGVLPILSTSTNINES